MFLLFLCERMCNLKPMRLLCKSPYVGPDSGQLKFCSLSTYSLCAVCSYLCLFVSTELAVSLRYIRWLFLLNSVMSCEFISTVCIDSLYWFGGQMYPTVCCSGNHQCMPCCRHSAIASYLHSQGYKETLEAFKGEADTVSLPTALS